MVLAAGELAGAFSPGHVQHSAFNNTSIELIHASIAYIVVSPSE